jgi:hypothetical protein
MNIRHLVLAVVIVTMFGAAPIQAEPSTSEQVKTWTLAQWKKARSAFVKDKEKWASCRSQNREKHLRGKASWSFLYGCMTS